MKVIKQYKKEISIVLGIFLIILIASAYFYNHGRTTRKALQNLDYGITQEKVVEYLGKPKNKTVDKKEIMNWTPKEIVNNEEKYSPLEMYVYKYEDGEARLFFSQGILLYKHPLKLNMSDKDYLDMYLQN